MKNLVLFLVFILLGFYLEAQNGEYFVYCNTWNGDTVVMSNIYEYQDGDTLIKTYSN